MADQVALRRLGFAFSSIVAIVMMVAAVVVSANVGVTRALAPVLMSHT
jgi:hypothetical protein